MRRSPFLIASSALVAVAAFMAPPGASAATPPTPTFTVFRPASTVPGATAATEPSIGFNSLSGAVLYLANLTTLRVAFSDAGASPVATYTDVSAPLTSQQTLDPILFTDRATGRTFVSQLTGADSLSEYTDNDGGSYTPSQGGGIPSGPDHQSIGAGPYASPLNGINPVYNRAVYYCSQGVAAAFCARSDNGGITFGAGVPIYTAATCGGLHGHVRVAPDGTVFVPDQQCSPTPSPQMVYTNPGVAISKDNGVTWNVSVIPDGASTARSDPSIAFDSAGTGYYGYEDGSGTPRVAVTHHDGADWSPSINVGASLGIAETSFPELIAGDAGRAAYAFLGSSVPHPRDSGDIADDPAFTGSWHLYVALTYDSGATWTTVQADPSIVEKGCIKLSSDRACTHRNLYDFNDITYDNQGRVLVGYANGCDAACQGGPDAHATDSTVHALAIARLCGGQGLVAHPAPEPGAVSCRLSEMATGSATPAPSPSGTPTTAPGAAVAAASPGLPLTGRSGTAAGAAVTGLAVAVVTGARRRRRRGSVVPGTAGTDRAVS